MENTWHILRVVSGTERKVASRIGVPSYVPQKLHRSFHRKHRRVVKRFLPALPGMVFVRASDPRSMQARFPGVIGWMRDGSRNYITLSNQDFHDMRRLELEVWCSLGDNPPDEGLKFSTGDVVTVHGHRAVIERLRGNRALFRVLSNGIRMDAGLDEVKLVA